jgi:hypothetical protein
MMINGTAPPWAAAVLGGWPTFIGAVGFTVVGLAAISFPMPLRWVPPTVLAICVVAARPLLN